MAAQMLAKVIGYLLVGLMAVIVTVGCGLGEPENTPTPQPDRGTLAEGEAIAIVQTHLASRYSGEKTCLEIYSLGGGSWTEKYLGNRVWSVTSYGITPGAWKVFERSGAVGEDEGVHSILLPGC